MTAERIVGALVERGVQIWAAAGELRLRAPRGTLTAELRGELERRKTDLLALLGRGRKFAPLSFAQQRLWFLHRLRPADASYNVSEAWWLEGDLDAGALAASLRRLVRRHESLRTSFGALDGRGVQVIARADTFRGPTLLDLTRLPAPGRRSEALRRASQLAAAPLALASGPLFSAVLFRLGPAEHLLALKLHHIVCDGWSLGVARREIAALYEELAGGRPARLPELALQYADFAVRQRRELAGETLVRHLDYWRRQLADLALLRMPADRPRPALSSHRGGVVEIAVPEASAGALSRLSRQAGASLYMGLLSAFVILLHRYTGQRDVAVGTPVAGRNRREIEGLIGFFVNTLVMRGNLARERRTGEPDGREILRRLRETAFEAYAHQDLPFEKLVDELRPARDLSRNPLFQVSLALHNAPEPEPQPPGLAITGQEIERRRAHFDLELHLHERSGALDGILVYSAELFDPSTVARLVAHFVRLVTELAAHPARRIPELGVLSAAERHQLLREWSDGGGAEDDALCYHQLFARQAERAPEAAAVVADETILTFGELDRRANRAAHALRQLGVSPETRVAMIAERSAALPAAALGTLKAGGAWVPLDPAFGAERRAFLLADSGARTLLALTSTAGFCPAGVRLVDARPGGELFRCPAADPPDANVAPANAAYVIYTSGSTGRPRGVVVEHRQLVAYARAAGRALALGAAPRAAPLTSFATDLAHTTIFPVLACGGAVVIAGGEHLASAEAAGRYFARHPIDVAKTVPSHLAALLDSRRARELLPRRVMVLGGESLGWDLVDRIAELEPRCHVVNHYGPTETTVGVATFAAAAPRRGTASVPVGRPLAGSSVILGDRRLEPVAAGVHGQIAIAGAQLARGYQGRPGPTAERFVPDPFAAAPGARLYLTGDLARQLAHGAVEFLGRLDRQLKIRGFRVEPGEVEAVLRELPAVRDAAVVAAGEAGARRLVAFFAPPGNERAVVEHLRRRLPAYMVPAAFEGLAELPRSATGKIDGRALRRLASSIGERFAAPATAARSLAEEALAEIWSDVLGASRVGADDDFFDLGGHSLLGTQVMSRIERTFGVELPLRSLFENPTVAGLAERIETLLEAGAGLAPPPIERRPRDVAPPLSFAQQRLWFLDQLAPGSAAYNTPVVFRLAGDLHAGALERCFGEIVRRHETLRTTFASLDGQARQIVSDALVLPWAVIDLRRVGRSGEPLRIAAEEAGRPFDLRHGPLLRIRLLRLADDEHLLLVTFHHIISDGWSHGVFHRELTALYRAFARHRPSPLAELPVQYADFAVWQRRWLAGQAIEEQLRPYLGKLAGVAEAAFELTPDRLRRRPPSHRGEAVAVAISAADTASLKRLSLDEKASFYMTLVAAFATLLHRATGRRSVVVGSPIANRNRREIEGLIGFFVNMLVLPADLAGDPPFRRAVGRIREVALEAFAHQNVPFEKLVEKLAPERDAARHPLFQIAFALQNAPRAAVELPGLRTSRLDPPAVAARFDLELFLWEEEDRLEGSFVYRADLFDATTVVRLGRSFERLLHGVARGSGRRLSELDAATAGERHQLLVEWNDRERELPADARVDRLFADQARRTPDAALLFAGERLSYRQLDRRADRLAQRLRSLGVGPESRVGVFLQRSFELVAAILGILKAGGAFVPLEPDHPRHRLAYLIRDADLRIVLTGPRMAPLLPPGPIEVVVLGGGDEARHPPSGPPLEATDPSQAAYVIYTSGSTGRPKGVVVTHRGLASHMSWMRADFPLAAGDRLVQKTPLGFDVAVWEIFWALLTGANLVLARPGGHREPGYLAELARQHDATALHFVPSMLPVFLDEPGAGRLGSLRRVVCGGEALPPELVRRFRERLPGVEICNFYGPSEATVGITAWVCGREGRDARVPIGRGVANVRLYALAATLSPVAPGMAGELHAGGVQLARGYLGRPAATAERFVPDPLGGRAGERLYRTGDLVRHRADGALEFLGRSDSQVKIHGVRIELDEIAAVLAEHEAVREAAVIRDQQHGTRLVAYAVASDRYRQAGSERQVAHWREVYDALHSLDGEEPRELDVAGWNSSYTGDPIPPEEMQEWLDLTAERILALHPEKVLEVGCGNGLVVERVAPGCASYLGTDISARALHVLRARLAQSGRILPQVRLLERPADDFGGIEPGAFDTVVLSSVVQYFPGADYLLRVLAGAVEATAPGGAIFVGDVRSLPLAEVFYASVELHRAPDSLPLAELRQRARQRRLHEEELLVDPAFFAALRRRLARIRQVRLLPKRGRFANELTLFRYDVVLFVDSEERDTPAPPGRGAPQRFLSREVRMVELLRSPPPGMETAGDLRAALGDPETAPGVSEVDSTFSPALPPGAGGDAAWSVWTNDPLRRKTARELGPRLLEHLRRRLPETMVPASVVLLDALPLTPSGKVDRAALRGAETGGGTRPHLTEDFAAPRTAGEEALARIWAELLELDRVGVHDNFFRLGGDSILGIRIVARAREAGLELALKDLFRHQTVAELAGAATSGARRRDSAPVAGSVPLTPIQCWFFEQEMAEPWHYNQSTLLATPPLDARSLELAVAHLLRHHDVLRARFARHGASWRQTIEAPTGRPPVFRVDLSRLAASRRRRALERAAAELQASLDLERGPLLRAVFFDPGRLFLVIHHLIVDRVSWPILLEDLARAYREAAAGRPVDLGAKTTSFQQWAELLVRHARSEEARGELGFWLDHLPASAAGLPTDGSGAGLRAAAETVSVELTAGETRRLLHDLPAVYGTRILDPLLTALVRAFAGWTGRRSLLVELEGHGREEIAAGVDLSRTVGWLTSTFPVFLDLEGVGGDRESLLAVRDRLRAVPRHGLGYGLLRHLSADPTTAAALRRRPRPGVRLNYMGRIERPPPTFFDFAAESEGANVSPRQRRHFLLELNGYVVGGVLRIDWQYSRGVHRASTVAGLARSFVAELRQLTAHCLQQLPSR